MALRFDAKISPFLESNRPLIFLLSFDVVVQPPVKRRGALEGPARDDQERHTPAQYQHGT